MKKKIGIILISTITILVLVITSILYAYKNNKGNYDTADSSLAIMVQSENNNTEYHQWSNGAWPDEKEYQLNTSKSMCNNKENVTDIVSYENNEIRLKTNKSYNCQLFFDKKITEPLKIEHIDVDTETPFTAKLTVTATGGDGNYTYSVINSCECGLNASNNCSHNGDGAKISINDNVITVSNLNTCCTHAFNVNVTDGAGKKMEFIKDNINVDYYNEDGKQIACI